MVPKSSSGNMDEDGLRTAQFIPSSILQTLYSVNPVFLHLALNERYRDIDLTKCWTAATAKYLEHLK